MDSTDKQKIVDRYNERAKQYGHGPAAIGEPKCRQGFYYHTMLPKGIVLPEDSILDVGCGYGDLGRYLQSIGWQGKYCGIDINGELVLEGLRRQPEANLRVHDIQEKPLDAIFDWCFACHVITSNTEATPYLKHLESMVAAMWNHAEKGVIFNLLSPLADYTNPIHARPKIGDVVDVITKITNRFSLRHDYMPYEYTLYLYKNNEINRELLIYSDHDAIFEATSFC